MINLIPIIVHCHSGYKADEYPKFFDLDDKVFEIADITDRWYQGANNPEWPASNYFKVIATDRKEYILKHDLDKDKWYLCQ
jgi:hypothetical protein